MLFSPLEYEPASSSRPRSRARSERCLACGGLAGPPWEKRLPCGGRANRGRHEERRGERGFPTGHLEEAHVHVGLGLDPLEVEHEDVLGLEALGHLLEALALESLLGLDALLLEGHAERIAHADAEASGSRETVDQLLHRGFDQVVPDAGGKRQHGQSDLSGRHARLVPGSDAAALGHGRPGDGVGLGDFLHPYPPDRLFLPAENLAGLGVLELFTLVDDDQLHACHDSVAPTYGQRDLGAVHLEDIALDLGEERGHLADERRDRGGRRPRPAAWRRLGGLGPGQLFGPCRRGAEGQQEDKQDDPRHGAHDTDPRVTGQAMGQKTAGPEGRPPGPAHYSDPRARS